MQDKGVSVSIGPEANPLIDRIRRGIAVDGGWWPFDRFMHAALYEPGLGYYSSGRRIFGAMPAAASGAPAASDARHDAAGSDFVTAPEMSVLFARTLARQLAQVLRASGAHSVWEFGAGRGTLARDLIDALDALGVPVKRYTIVDVSGSLAATQRQTLERFGGRVAWASSLPERLDGVVIGNEVLDAMPVKRLRLGLDHAWREQGVVVAADGSLAYDERATTLTPPHDGAFVDGTLVEIHPQALAFTATVAERLAPGAVALFVDYGFPRAEHYHPQRTGGTLMCHRAHRADDEPLRDVGEKDITAHIDFTGIALAAQDAGADVLGYTSQGRFLLNCGFVDELGRVDLRERIAAQRLVVEHEMGELFKVIAFGRALSSDSPSLELLGFVQGDRTHRL
jgi:SAM-dependent MidA family methyltransferase